MQTESEGRLGCRAAEVVVPAEVSDMEVGMPRVDIVSRNISIPAQPAVKQITLDMVPVSYACLNMKLQINEG
jgi:hypothetical protein